ncbi:MAG: beta-ketoacyl-ACP synthase III [bacterium]
MNNRELNSVSIVGVGKGLPETVITNEDLSKIVDTNEEWIVSRTGIKERRVVSGNETSVSLAVTAAKDALGFAGINAEDVDLIITATSLPDNLYPSTACEVQSAIGAKNAAAFDIVAACSGLVYGMNIARNFIMTGTYKTVLLIGVDVHSRYIDWTDRGTCILFGDGAGALVLTKSEDGVNDLLSVKIQADGSKANELKIPLNGENCPLVTPRDQRPPYVAMNGKEIYKFAVTAVPASIRSALELAGMTIDDLDYFIPHQANIRIVSAISERLNLKEEQAIVNLDKYGNTSTASVAIALCEAIENEKINIPSVMALCGFGAGLTWGTAIIRWRAQDQRKKQG